MGMLKYEKPFMDVVVLSRSNVVQTSWNSLGPMKPEQGGDSEGTDGGDW